MEGGEGVLGVSTGDLVGSGSACGRWGVRE